MQACERRARERERNMDEEEDEREKLVFMAKLAEQAERYDDMVESMKKIAKMDIEPTGEERNLLSISYKNIICPRRVSWRIISSLEEKERAEGPEKNLRRFEEYKKHVEDEISKISNEILSIVVIHLLPNSTSGESIVFFCKMQGDYYRYLAEFKEGNEKKDDVNQALKAYQAATSTAMSELAPAHPIRLGLALNFSVFYYEILKLPKRACNMAKQAFDEAIRELNSISEEMYKDSILIMKLLKDNLTLWTSDLPPPQGGDQTNEINMN